MRTILSVAVLGLAVSGCGGGGGGSSAAAGGGGGGGGGGTTTPPVSSSAPKLVQTNTFQTTGANTGTDVSLAFLNPTKAGDAIWVAVTVPDYGGVHTISVSDSQGNTYLPLKQLDDPAPGSQSVAHFYAANIHGDAATPDTVKVTWGFDNYQGVLITEISGVTQRPLVGHNELIQDGLAAGTDNVKSGAIPVSAAQTPALVLALSMDTSGGTSDIGGSGAPGPAAGTGLTQEMTLWTWGKPLATFATGTITSAESFTSVFSASHVDSYVTVAAIFH